MRGVLLPLCLLAGLLLLSRLRVGGRLEYTPAGLRVWVKLFGLSIPVFPGRAKRAAGAPGPAPKAPRRSLPGADRLRQLLPVVCQAAGELKRTITIDTLELELLWGLPDPAACALGFGGSSAALGMLWPLLEQNFHIRSHQIRTGLDFDRQESRLTARVQLTLTLGQAVAWGVRTVLRAARVLRGEAAPVQTRNVPDPVPGRGGLC